MDYGMREEGVAIVLSRNRVGALIFFWCLMLAGLFAMTAVMCYGDHVAESVKRQLECATIVGEKPKCR